MTVSEMHVAVKLGLDKSSALELPSFEPEEIDYWLNNAQDEFIRERYKQYLTAVNANDNPILLKINKDLSPIIRDTVLSGSGTSLTQVDANFSGGKLYSLAFDSLQDSAYVLKVHVRITRTLEDGSTATNEYVPCKFINLSELDRYLTTPFNEPYFEQPVYYVSEEGDTASVPLAGENVTAIRILVDYFTSAASSAGLTYLITPQEINITTGSPNGDSILPNHTHQEIVDICVNKLIENIESGRFQTNSALLNKV